MRRPYWKGKSEQIFPCATSPTAVGTVTSTEATTSAAVPWPHRFFCRGDDHSGRPVAASEAAAHTPSFCRDLMRDGKPHVRPLGLIHGGDITPQLYRGLVRRGGALLPLHSGILVRGSIPHGIPRGFVRRGGDPHSLPVASSAPAATPSLPAPSLWRHPPWSSARLVRRR